MKTNPVLDAIRNRRSVRTYDPRPLPADVLATIVEAGTLAPTGMNAQTFHFTVIQDAEKLHELNRLIRTALIRYEGRQLNEDYCCYYDAPVLVIASNEPTRTGGMDCACALQICFSQPTRSESPPAGSISSPIPVTPPKYALTSNGSACRPYTKFTVAPRSATTAAKSPQRTRAKRDWFRMPNRHCQIKS